MKISIANNSYCTCHITTINESKRAALILCDYFNKVTGKNFNINNNLATSDNIIFSLSNDYGDSGFSYEIINSNLYFYAKNEQSFVYGVYDLLESIIGCRYYSKNYEYVPNINNLDISMEEKYCFIPKIDYREVYYKEFEDKYFSEKHKISPSGVHEGWGFWSHSFKDLIPNNEYFEEYPEYFALINGERNPKGEPCLSNSNVKKIIINNLREFMDKKPECKYWSVSQNDDNLYCRCDECSKIDDYDESQMGSILTFVNEVANTFKDKVISTLSYWYSIKPPKHTRAVENVHIMVCNIEANRGLPIESDLKSIESKNAYLDWSSITGNVSLWDYNIQFNSLVSPFPNLRTIGPNMRFFVDNNLKLLFSQCNREIGGEFHELRAYMLAKLAWNPYCDENLVMEDFCKGYYGEAYKYILEYINKLHDVQNKYNERLDIFGGPKNAEKTFLSVDLFNYYEELFNNAEKCIKNDEPLLLRVETARIPLYYAGVVLQYGDYEDRLKRIRKFAMLARNTGLEKVEEWKITVDKFVTDSIIKLG